MCVDFERSFAADLTFAEGWQDLCDNTNEAILFAPLTRLEVGNYDMIITGEPRGGEAVSEAYRGR